MGGKPAGLQFLNGYPQFIFIRTAADRIGSPQLLTLDFGPKGNILTGFKLKFFFPFRRNIK